MNRLSHHLRGNAVAYLALFVALGGSSYAAINLPAGSVGPRQIRNHSITPIKFDPTKIGASVRYWAVVDGNGRVLASHPKPRTFGFVNGDGSGVVTWGRPTQANCYPLATINDILPGFASVSIAGLAVDVSTYDTNGAPASRTVDVAVLCPSR
jgi:hypothetical protein